MPLRGRGGQRRKLVWATDFFNVTVAAGAKLPQRDLLANLEVAGASVLGSTIVRTHTQWAITWLTSDTAPGFFYGYIVNTAPTVTNLDPSSASAFGDDWMLHSTMAPGNVNRQAFVTGTNIFAGHEVDLRAKRKIQELSEKYWLVLANTGPAVLAVSGFTKTLLALP